MRRSPTARRANCHSSPLRLRRGWGCGFGELLDTQHRAECAIPWAASARARRCTAELSAAERPASAKAIHAEARRRGVRGVKTLLGLGLSCKLLGRKLLDTHKASRVFRVTAPIRRVIRQWSLAQIRGKDRVQLNTEKPDTGSTLGDKFPTCSLRSTEGKASLGEGVLTVRIGAANLAGAFVCLCRVQAIEV